MYNVSIAIILFVFLLLLSSSGGPFINNKKPAAVCDGFTLLPSLQAKNKAMKKKNNNNHLNIVVVNQNKSFRNHNQQQHGVKSSLLIQQQLNKKDVNNEKEEQLGELQRYNDDAFGLVFLIGGFAYQDVDFALTFLSLSALAAIGTSKGTLDNDARIPGVVAITSLIVSKIVMSLRISGSLDMIQIPSSLETSVCLISMAVGIYKWNQGQKQ